MAKLTFKDIEEKGMLIYRYVRGSTAYGTNTPESDVDEGGVFICPNEQLLDLGFDYQDEVCDEKHDTCWWEIGKFMRLIIKSNPTVLEALFIPDDKVLYEHPIMTFIKSHRNEFVTKMCFNPFAGYAVSQIKKAQGQDKKIHWDVAKMTRKTPLDFCHTFNKQGSINIQKWLKERGLNQRNIGLVNIPNMEGNYGAYYDFGQHIRLAHMSKKYFCNPENKDKKFIKFTINHILKSWDENGIYVDGKKENIPYNSNEHSYDYNADKVFEYIKTPKGGHCGIVNVNETSNDIRTFSDETGNGEVHNQINYDSHVKFSSVLKGDVPICIINYNQNGYQSHCRKWLEYVDWQKNRNKARYENNLEGKEKENVDKFYDAKNIMHCFRLVAMAREVARGEGLKINRRGIDADFLLDVRNRKYTYTELMEHLNNVKTLLDEEIKASTIPDAVDVEKINQYLLDIRTGIHLFCYI